MLQSSRRLRPSFSATTFFLRDKGLDHTVLRERNLKAVMTLKNLIKAEPSKSLPLSIITSSLPLPMRPVSFIRRYPLLFHEFQTPPDVHPHVKLTKEALELDAEEGMVYESVEYRQDLADRLLRLLMIGRRNGIKLSVLEGLKWELGLPEDFVEAVVPEFPDYFVVKDDALEVVCWIDELAVSAIELLWLASNVGRDEEGGGRRGQREKREEKLKAGHYPMKYSTGFVMEKKYKMFVEEWQKLPFVSPYQAEVERVTRSDEFDKYGVGVLHEVLNLFVGLKGDKESVLCVGDHFGLRARFKRALLEHPGIFYVSSKNRTYTVILRDGYKRGALIKKNPLMEMRFKYLKLMQPAKEGDKQKDDNPKNKDKGEDQEDGDESDESNEEEDEEVSGLSNVDSDSEEDDEQGGYHDDNVSKRGRFSNEAKYSGNKFSRGDVRTSARASSRTPMGDRTPRSNRKSDVRTSARASSRTPMGDRTPRFNRKSDYQGENLYPRSNRNNDNKSENYSARSRGSADVGRQGRGSERKNNRTGQWPTGGAKKEIDLSKERLFTRTGEIRENKITGVKKSRVHRRGADKEQDKVRQRQRKQPLV